MSNGLKKLVGLSPSDGEQWPIIRVVGHLESLSQRDVRAYVKGHVERHFSEYADERAFLALKRYRNGWLYELMLGGDGRTCVDGLAEFLDAAQPDDRLTLPAAYRSGELSCTAGGKVVFRLLPESANVAMASPMPTRRRAPPLYPTYRSAFFAGGAVMLLGSSVLAFTLGLTAAAESAERSKAFDRLHERQRLHLSRQYANSPANQVDMGSLHQEAGRYEYVLRLELTNGRWNVAIGCEGELCDGPVE